MAERAGVSLAKRMLRKILSVFINISLPVGRETKMKPDPSNWCTVKEQRHKLEYRKFYFNMIKLYLTR